MQSVYKVLRLESVGRELGAERRWMVAVKVDMKLVGGREKDAGQGPREAADWLRPPPQGTAQRRR